MIKFLINHKRTLFCVLLFVAILLLMYKCGRDSVVVVEKSTKELRVDTIYKIIKEDAKEVVKWKTKVEYLKDNTPTYPKECEPIVKYIDSIINIQDTIILKQDSIIYKYDTIYQVQKEIIEDVRCKKKLGFWTGFGAGFVAGGVGGIFISK